MLRGEVRKVGAIRSSVESKTLRRPGMSRAAKVGIDEVLLRNLPARPLARRARADVGFAGIATPSSSPHPCRHPSVARTVARRWAADKTAASARSRLHSRWWRCRWYRTEARSGLGADAAHIPVVQFRLDHVAQLPVPEGKLEIALQAPAAGCRSKLQGPCG